jgi:carbonic anhydrase
LFCGEIIVAHHDHAHDGDACRDISHLLEGIKRFRQRFYEDNSELMHRLVDQGQSPPALVISCSDSRVDPTLSDADPGQLWCATWPTWCLLTIPHTISTARAQPSNTRYATWKVDHIIVLGHAHCGGIKAMLGGAGGQWLQSDFIGNWVSMALDASRLQLGEGCPGPTPAGSAGAPEGQPGAGRARFGGRLAEEPHELSWVRERVEAGNLVLHGWWFDLDTGDLWTTEPGGTQLMPVID